MAGEATILASEAILKTKYKDGVEKTHFETFPFFATTKKREDFNGKNKQFTLQSEDPQGAGAEFEDAYSTAAQGAYDDFVVTPAKFFTTARIAGDALKQATGAGALVDLWDNETEGAKNNSIRYHEIYCLGNGTGVLGTIDDNDTNSDVTTDTVRLLDKSKCVNFSIGCSYSLVSSATSLSPTLRNSGAAIKLIKINRKTGDLKFAVAVNTISGAANSDSFVLKGTSASAGKAKIFTGMQQWVEGSDTPPDLFGCVRSNDAAKFAGQQLDAADIGMEDALIEAEAMLQAQNFLSANLVAWCNPHDIAELKKTQLSKVNFNKDAQLNSPIAGLSFSGFVVNGVMGKIKLMPNAFQPKGEVLLCDMSDVCFESSGPSPHCQDYDGRKMERVPGFDLWAVRFGSYGQLFNYKPFRGVRILNWSAE